MASANRNRRPITKVLVANRSEIARRIIASCRRVGIATVAVHSDPDADAPFVAEAGEAVPLGGVGAAESYLDGDRLIEAARRSGADAIHPGYGFLAESPGFARAVLEAGLTWIGPPAEAIEAMGSKVRARAMMAAAGVPTVPGAELADGADPGAEAERIGFPVLVKASAGGGGKGMRTVSEPADLGGAVEAARREAAAAFGDDTVYLERFLQRPRHVEIQVFADLHGHTVSLGERECSIQRRHQKIVEEAPSPAVDAELRERLGAAAIAAAEAVGYVGAGTVEFMLVPGGEFFFLEMNTRLQVEHPVTELLTGLDLVRLQLLVAAGEPLPAEALAPGSEPRGHAIEARLYAEDPATGFLPQTGTLSRLRVAGAEPFARPGRLAGSGLRLDSGVEDGSEISPHYDPMLAKLIAWAPTRDQAAAILAAGLAGSEIHGPTTNRDLLVRVLRHPSFAAGETDTGFLERHRGLDRPLADRAAERLHAAAAALAAVAARREGPGSVPLGSLPPGFRNNPSQPQRIRFSGTDGELEVAYRFARRRLELAVDGERLEGVRLRGLEAEVVDLEVGGIRRAYRVRRAGEVHWVNSALGQSALTELPRFPTGAGAAREGALIAPMPGKVIRLAVAVGEQVGAGDLVAVLEAMKMEHELTAPAAGTVEELRVGEGDQVDAGAVLAIVA